VGGHVFLVSLRGLPEVECFFFDQDDVRVAENDEVGVIKGVQVGVKGELGGEAVELLVDDAVDGERALEDGWVACCGVSAVVDYDASPSALAGGAHTVRTPDTPGMILEEGDLGEVAREDLSTKMRRVSLWIGSIRSRTEADLGVSRGGEELQVSVLSMTVGADGC
jgi:hypothetical protein